MGWNNVTDWSCVVLCNLSIVLKKKKSDTVNFSELTPSGLSPRFCWWEEVMGLESCEPQPAPGRGQLEAPLLTPRAWSRLLWVQRVGFFPLLRSDVQSLKFTSLKHPVSWCLVCSPSGATIIIAWFWSISHPSQTKPHTGAIHSYSPSLPTPSPLQPKATVHLSVSVIWGNHTVLSFATDLFHLVNAFKVHPCCGMVAACLLSGWMIFLMWVGWLPLVVIWVHPTLGLLSLCSALSGDITVVEVLGSRLVGTVKHLFGDQRSSQAQHQDRFWAPLESSVHGDRPSGLELTKEADLPEVFKSTLMPTRDPGGEGPLFGFRGKH